jgi:hypothetical protein
LGAALGLLAADRGALGFACLAWVLGLALRFAGGLETLVAGSPEGTRTS